MEEKQKKILVLGCGGTIVSLPGPDGALVPAKTVDDILTAIPVLKKREDIEVRQIENRDSTDLTPAHWTRFATIIAEATQSGNYCGILLTHGTDTMAYSATAVGIALGNHLKIPVVFTGSQRSLFTDRSDAQFNVENAVAVILEAARQNIAEVMIVFSYDVLRGTRAMKNSESKFDAFESPAFPPLATMSGLNDITFAPAARRVCSKTQAFQSDDKLDFHFNSDIMTLDLSPGTNPQKLSRIISSGMYQAFILRSLGAGNVPSFEEYSLIPCIQEAVRLGIPVVITTKFTGGTTHAGIYGSGKAALDAGAIESGNLTDVAVYVKLMWLLAKGKRTYQEIQEALLTPVAGEVSR